MRRRAEQSVHPAFEGLKLCIYDHIGQGDVAAHARARVSDREELAQLRLELSECELENEELHKKLERCEAKVEVLSEVLSRKNA